MDASHVETVCITIKKTKEWSELALSNYQTAVQWKERLCQRTTSSGPRNKVKKDKLQVKKKEKKHAKTNGGWVWSCL